MWAGRCIWLKSRLEISMLATWRAGILSFIGRSEKILKWKNFAMSVSLIGYWMVCSTVGEAGGQAAVLNLPISGAWKSLLFEISFATSVKLVEQLNSFSVEMRPCHRSFPSLELLQVKEGTSTGQAQRLNCPSQFLVSRSVPIMSSFIIAGQTRTSMTRVYWKTPDLKDLLAAATQSNEVAAFLKRNISWKERSWRRKNLSFSALKLLLNRRKYV